METRINIDDIMEMVKVYDEIKGRVDNCTEACAILTEICKDRRSKEIQASKSFGRSERQNAGNELGVSTKQLAFMRKLSIVVPNDCTKAQARELIDKALGKIPVQDA